MLTALFVSLIFIKDIPAYADTLSDLNFIQEEGNDSYVLKKSIFIKSDTVLTTDRNNVLVIPSGKRITVKNGATLTLNGNLFVEKGGWIVVESGKLLIDHGARLLSYGRIKVGANGKLSVNSEASLIVSPTGILTSKGQISAPLDSACVICLGKYSGREQGIKAEIIAAVSFVQTDMYNMLYGKYNSYSADEARELFPEKAKIDDCQSYVGNASMILRIFCSNGQTIRVTLSSAPDYQPETINGIHVIV